MELHIFLKGKAEPMIFSGDRIDVLDIEMHGIKYKQIRYFRKGFYLKNLIRILQISWKVKEKGF